MDGNQVSGSQPYHPTKQTSRKKKPKERTGRLCYAPGFNSSYKQRGTFFKIKITKHSYGESLEAIHKPGFEQHLPQSSLQGLQESP